MAKTTLPTNYVDDVLNGAMDGKRRYRQIPNADGTISLEDVTTYDQVGSNFGASQLNAMNKAINESFDSNKMLKTSDELSAVTEEGYGVDALVVKEINDSLKCSVGNNTQSATLEAMIEAYVTETTLPKGAVIHRMFYPSEGQLFNVTLSRATSSGTYSILAVASSGTPTTYIGRGGVGADAVLKKLGSKNFEILYSMVGTQGCTTETIIAPSYYDSERFTLSNSQLIAKETITLKSIYNMYIQAADRGATLKFYKNNTAIITKAITDYTYANLSFEDIVLNAGDVFHMTFLHEFNYPVGVSINFYL